MKNNDIYFLHIGKCGGTSIDHLINQFAEKVGRKYIGFKHFDYSYISSNGTINIDIDFITMLRNPVVRAVSQFYFSKKLDWTKGLIMKNQSFYEHIRDDESMKQYTQALTDGESGSWWLSGVWKSGSWVLTDGKDSAYKERLRKEKKECLIIAARNLDKSLWFGLLEDVPRSMELLKYNLKLEDTPKLLKKNTNNYKSISDEDVKIVEKYLEGDIWLYNYSKLLFEARWNEYKGQAYIHPKLPDFNF